MRSACTVLYSSVACLVLPYFSTLSHKQHDFWGEKVTEHKTCALILSTTEIFLILRTEQDIIKCVNWSSC
jgi:hypothetical protein